MPIPKPRSGESENEFINRCMSNEVMVSEYEDEEVRIGICYSQWENRKQGGRLMERKIIKFEADDVDEEEGTFTGYASTFTKIPDSYGDVVDKGAFKKTIKEDKNRIKVLWNHSGMEPIGKPINMKEDDTGLLVKAKLTLGVRRAREVLSLMKDKVINEMSIGYDTITSKWEGEGINRIRHLKEVRLYDVSPVSFAANPSALILDAKAIEDYAQLTQWINEELTNVKAGRVLSAANIGKLEDALKALQALLEAAKPVEEPEKSTPTEEELEEAANSKLEPDKSTPFDVIIDELKAENEGFDLKAAEARIDKALAQLKIKQEEVK